MANNDGNEAISIKIGVDTSDILRDLDDATKSLKGKVSAANAELKHNKIVLEAELQTAKAEKNWDRYNSLLVQKYKQQRTVYQREMELYQQSLDDYIKSAGSNADRGEINKRTEQIARLRIQILKAAEAEKKWSSAGSIGSLKDQLAGLKDDLIDAMQTISPAAAGALRNIDSVFSAFEGKFSAIRKKLTSTKGVRLVSAASIIGGGFGAANYLDTIEEKAKTTATSLENLQRRAAALGVSFKEYAGLNTLAQLAGVDIQPAISRMTELNKSISTAGASGNEVTKMLDKWGISLRRDDGSYKSFTEQIQTLAEGYRKAVQEGNGYAYSVEVLGNSFNDVLPLLANFNKYQKEASELVKTGYADPKAAQQLADLKRLYEVQQKQNAGIGGYLGVEGATEYYKEMLEVEKSWAQFNKENKTAMQSLARFLVSIEKSFTGLLQKMELMIAKASQTTAGRLAMPAVSGAAGGAAIGGLIGGLPGAGVGAAIGGLSGLTIAAYNELFGDQEEAAAAVAQSTEAAAEAEQEHATAAAETADALKAQAENAQKIEAMNSEISDKIYTLTHTDLENELHAIEKEREKYVNAGANEESASTLAALEREKVIAKYQEEERKKAEAAAEAEARKREQAAREQKQREEQLAREREQAAEKRKSAEAEISAIFRTDFENRLDQIEKEKAAWISAGADEVRATQAAEAEKRKARESEAERYLRSNADLIKRAARLERAGATPDQIQENLAGYARKQELKNLGLNENQINVGAKYVGVLDKITEAVKSQVLSPVTERLGNTNNVTVNIQNPTVADNQMIDAIADKVAGKINDAISMGSVANGY